MLIFNTFVFYEYTSYSVNVKITKLYFGVYEFTVNFTFIYLYKLYISKNALNKVPIRQHFLPENMGIHQLWLYIYKCDYIQKISDVF